MFDMMTKDCQTLPTVICLSSIAILPIPVEIISNQLWLNFTLPVQKLHTAGFLIHPIEIKLYQIFQVNTRQSAIIHRIKQNFFLSKEIFFEFFNC